MPRVYRNPILQSPTGQAVWVLDYYDATGKRRREKTDVATKELAQRILRKRLDEVEEAKISGVRPVKEISFDDFTPEYLDHVNAVRSRSSQKKVPSMVRNLAKYFGGMQLSRVTGGDVQRWIDKRSQERKKNKQPIKPATVVSEFVTLSALFPEAKKGATLPRTPVGAFRFPGSTTRSSAAFRTLRKSASCPAAPTPFGPSSRRDFIRASGRRNCWTLDGAIRTSTGRFLRSSTGRARRSDTSHSSPSWSRS